MSPYKENMHEIQNDKKVIINLKKNYRIRQKLH